MCILRPALLNELICKNEQQMRLSATKKMVYQSGHLKTCGIYTFSTDVIYHGSVLMRFVCQLTFLRLASSQGRSCML